MTPTCVRGRRRSSPRRSGPPTAPGSGASPSRGGSARACATGLPPRCVCSRPGTLPRAPSLPSNRRAASNRRTPLPRAAPRCFSPAASIPSRCSAPTVRPTARSIRVRCGRRGSSTASTSEPPANRRATSSTRGRGAPSSRWRRAWGCASCPRGPTCGCSIPTGRTGPTPGSAPAPWRSPTPSMGASRMRCSPPISTWRARARRLPSPPRLELLERGPAGAPRGDAPVAAGKDRIGGRLARGTRRASRLLARASRGLAAQLRPLSQKRARNARAHRRGATRRDDHVSARRSRAGGPGGLPRRPSYGALL